MSVQSKTLNAEFIYSGMVDYWGGNGRRWDKDAGCLFAPYCHDSTLGDLIDDWVNDWNAGGDCDDMDEWSNDELRKALKAMLTTESKLTDKFGGCPDEGDFDKNDEWPMAIVLMTESDA